MIGLIAASPSAASRKAVFRPDELRRVLGQDIDDDAGIQEDIASVVILKSPHPGGFDHVLAAGAADALRGRLDQIDSVDVGVDFELDIGAGHELWAFSSVMRYADLACGGDAHRKHLSDRLP